MTRRALTPIEIPVVIAIVAVIAAPVTPAIVRAKEAADETSCKERLRQWHMAIGLYREQLGDHAT